MGVLVSQKIITPEATPLECDGKATVELILNATNSIQSNPVDIMLLLDQSGSMAGEPLDALKIATNSFIDIIDEATNNGTATGNLSGGTTIGIVRFDTTATFVNPPGMTTGVASLKSAINSLTALDWTCHGCALYTGRTSFDPASTNKKIMILFTDGQNNTFTYNADVQANEAKDAGIEIYCIGLGDSVDVDNLNRWSTDSDMSHVIIAPDIDDLIDAFEDLAANINLPGASNIDIQDTVYDEFDIIGTPVITFGGNPVPTPTTLATIASDKKSIRWTISELGKDGNESASLKFEIQHTSCTSGNKLVNEDITYSDTEGNTATFPNQDNTIEVNCDDNIRIDCCKPAEVVTIERCNDFEQVTLPLTGNGYELSCSGRLLSVYVNLRGVCPNRKIAVGVAVYEEVNDVLVPRGFKATEVTTAPVVNDLSCMCKNIKIGAFDFVLPENTTSCAEREFRVKVIAHYSDSLANYEITC